MTGQLQDHDFRNDQEKKDDKMIAIPWIAKVLIYDRLFIKKKKLTIFFNTGKCIIV